MLFVAAALSATLSALLEAISVRRQREKVGQGRVEIVHQLSRFGCVLEISSVLLVLKVS